MPTRYFALAYGIIFLLVGIAGFIPALVTGPEGPMVEEAPGVADGAEVPDAAEEAPAVPDADAEGAMAHGRLFGLFPVNPLHNIVHIAFGIWGLVAYRTFSSSRIYARSVAVIYGILAVMGLIPVLNTLWGLVPLYSHDVWLHAILAIIAAYFGWAVRPKPETATTTTVTR